MSELTNRTLREWEYTGELQDVVSTVRVCYDLTLAATCWPCITALIAEGKTAREIVRAFSLLAPEAKTIAATEMRTLLEAKLRNALKFARLVGDLSDPAVLGKWELFSGSIIQDSSAETASWKTAFEKFDAAQSNPQSQAQN